MEAEEKACLKELRNHVPGPLQGHSISLPEAAVTNYYRLDGLNNRHAFSLSSKTWKSKKKIPVGV